MNDKLPPGIEQAARAELAAEHDRDRAEAAWRRAWWVTTMALAGPREGDRKAISAALDAAEAILGQHRTYLSRRRRAGQHFIKIGVDQLAGWPPALAMIYADSRGNPAWAGGALAIAERQGLSLREFSAQVGVTPPVRQQARAASAARRAAAVGQDALTEYCATTAGPPTVEGLLAFHRARPGRGDPPATTAQLRAALKDPAIAADVLADPGIARTAYRAALAAGGGLIRPKPKRTRAGRFVHVRQVVVETVRAMTRLLVPEIDPLGKGLEVIADAGQTLPESDRVMLLDEITALIARAEAWHDRIAGIGGRTLGEPAA